MDVDDAGFTDSLPVRAENPTGSARRAVARSRITMLETTATSVADNTMKKGDVLGTARYAGVQAAKNAASLLPLCNPVLVRTTTVEFSLSDEAIEVEVVVESFDSVGVEMQALSAATAAALTIYDMCKSADRTMTIGRVALIERSGDPSTDWRHHARNDGRTGPDLDN